VPSDHWTVDGHDVRSEALRALGGGVAIRDTDGYLVGADATFLRLHGIVGDGVRLEPGRVRWPAPLTELGSCYATADSAAIEAAWGNLCDRPASTDDAVAPIGAERDSVRLSDGRVLEIALMSTDRDSALLVARDSSTVAEVEERRALQRSVVHEVNNALGGMLANLYLAVMDLAGDHPARERVVAANQAALDLRAAMRRIVEASDAESASRPAQQ